MLTVVFFSCYNMLLPRSYHIPQEGTGYIRIKHIPSFLHDVEKVKPRIIGTILSRSES